MCCCQIFVWTFAGKKKGKDSRVQGEREYVHAAVGEGDRLGVAGHALLLAVVGAGGWSQSVAGVCIVQGLPTGCVSAKQSGGLWVQCCRELKKERRRKGRSSSLVRPEHFSTASFQLSTQRNSAPGGLGLSMHLPTIPVRLLFCCFLASVFFFGLFSNRGTRRKLHLTPFTFLAMDSGKSYEAPHA